MADSYHIIDGQVVPYYGGRKGTDTDAWRDATLLELRLQEELNDAATELEALRKRCEAVEAMRFAGTLLSNIAFNLAQDDSLPETTRWSLDDARKRWDAVIAAAQEPSHG